jgi:protein TonB
VFEDSLFATNARPAPQRGLAAVISFSIQAVILTVLVLVPLIYTDALPLGNLKSYVEIPPPPGQRTAQPPPAHQQPRHQVSEMVGTTVLAPPHIPDHISRVVEDQEIAPPGDGTGVVGMPDGIGRGSTFVQNILASASHNVAPPPPPSVNHTVRLSSGVTEGFLIQRITPVYPAIARQVRAQGAVILQATISRNGTIQNLEVISGPALLARAALDAVRQWRYRPYMLNNEPVEVETQITVNFTLN